MESLAIPKNRKNLIELNDLVWKLKNAIKVKLELENQINLYSELVKRIAKKSLLDYLLLIVMPVKSRVKRLELLIKKSDLQMKLDVTLKNRNIYHRNEMQLEENFKSIYEDMETNYDPYINQLQSLYSTTNQDELSLYHDVKTLYNNFKNNPPKEKVDKLSFYLTLENLLYRINQL